MSVSVLNTDAGLSGKTIVTAEGAHTIDGLHTFDRDPNPPFAVSAGSAAVSNLDADKLDGYEASAFPRKAEAATVTSDWTMATVTATKFITQTASQSCLNNTATTIITLTSTAGATYLVSAHIANAGDPTNYGASYIAVQDGGTVRVAAISAGANLTVSVSGLALRATQVSGSTQTVTMTVTRIS